MISGLFINISKVVHGSFNTLVFICFLYQAWMGLKIRRGRKSGQSQFIAMKRHRRLGPFLVIIGVLGYCFGLAMVLIDTGKVLEYPLHLAIGSLIVLFLVGQYVVSKRIDNDIINNFWDIRKPNDFQNVYYNSILQTINQYFKGKDKTKSIGVDIEDDIDVAKFILSNDLQDFKDNLTSNYKNIEIENQNKDKFDVLVTVSTQGYESTLYKGIVTFWDKNDQTENDYYIFDKYENGGWNIQITADKPSGF